MMNVVIPLAGNLYFESSEYIYHKPLIEVRGVPIIQLVIESLRSLPDPKRFIFIINKADDDRFHLQETFRLLTNQECEVVLLQGQTKGAACSVLMAVHLITGNDPLVIANGDQTFNIELSTVIDDFTKRDLDAGVICFDSIHPRWSYVRSDHEGQILEAAEKRPLSRSAIAGFYYFAKGGDFVRLAMNSIEKGADVNGIYFISPVINEYVLEDRRVGFHQVENSRFRSFYSVQKIQEAQRES